MSDWLRDLLARVRALRETLPEPAPAAGGVPPAPESSAHPVFEALQELALGAQALAGGRQYVDRNIYLKSDFIAAEVARLSVEERAALLAELTVWQPPPSGPYGFHDDRFATRARDAFAALHVHKPPPTPEVAADFCRLYTKYSIRRFLAILAHWEKGDRAAFAAYQPLKDAYQALRAKYSSLHESRVVAAEIDARMERLLGLVSEGSAGPVVALATQIGVRSSAAILADFVPRTGAADFEQIQAFATSFEVFREEKRRWLTEVYARAPHFIPRPRQSYAAPLHPDPDEADWRCRSAPVQSFADVDPPSPAWLQRVDSIFAQVRARDCMQEFWRYPQAALPLAGSLETRFDSTWLLEGRRIAALIEAQTLRDWGASFVIEEARLRPQGRADLADLLWRARSAVPTKSWLKDAQVLIDGGGRDVIDAVGGWIDLAAEPCAPGIERQAFAHCFLQTALEASILSLIEACGSPTDAAALVACGDWGECDRRLSRWMMRAHPGLLSEENELVLRGAVWLLSLDAGSVPRLLRLALALLVRVPVPSGQNYRSLKGLNACIWSLGRIATPEAVIALGRIQRRIRDERLSKQVAKAMADAAAQAGMTIEDLEEIAVPNHDLEPGGTRSLALAEGHGAVLSILSSTEVAVTLHRPGGKPAKSLPAAVKADAESSAALKALKATATEIAQTLPVLRLRLERGWLTGRRWTGAQFRERLLEEPLTAWLATRLIWTVTPADGRPARSLFLRDTASPVAADDRPLPPIAEDDQVTLWHPLAPVEPEAVRDWRSFLIRHGITQPIKQAHREVYPLTPAEEATRTYSNRFSGHIIRQAQANTLARLRGWSARSRISADVPNDEPTHIKLPAFDVAAEYWTEPSGGDETTDNLAYLFLKTDRVRFRRLQDAGEWRRDGGRGLALLPEEVPLVAVPPILFSEVMRDVDLFVGVASIGHDPNWVDAGGEAQHPNQWRRGPAADYWRDFNTAELTESAKARRSFLAELLPKLAIAAQCQLDERHLVVRGTLHTYRIHLGSGNIFMEPGDRYLCIVPGPAAPQPAVLLPFEGDRLLSIILSKAFLLAKDNAIKDPGILAQIRAA